MSTLYGIGFCSFSKTYPIVWTVCKSIYSVSAKVNKVPCCEEEFAIKNHIDNNFEVLQYMIFSNYLNLRIFLS